MDKEFVRVYHEILRLLHNGKGKEITEELGLNDEYLGKMMETAKEHASEGTKMEEEKENQEEKSKHGYHLVYVNLDEDRSDFDIDFFEDDSIGKDKVVKRIKELLHDNYDVYLFHGENIPYIAKRQEVTEVAID